MAPRLTPARSTWQRRDPAEVRALLASRVLVCDGAMGTMLHAGGVSLDRSLPGLNLSHPDLVRAIHRAYIAAGTQIVETNTFGASRFRLARHGLDERIGEINHAGVRLAREACEHAGVTSLLVAGSVSPATPAGLGHRLTTRELRDAFRDQLSALIDGGVDLLVFETFGSLAEMVDAVSVAIELGDLPIVSQMTFVEDGRTLGGDSPEEVATTLEGLGVAALGANCTLGPQGLLDIIAELARCTTLPLTAQPNAGPPTLTDGQFQYTADPGYFARHAKRFVQLGATIVGGCCGTTPTHIEAVAAAVSGLDPVPRQKQASLRTPIAPADASAGPRAGASQLATQLAKHTFVLACELPPPLGGDADLAIQDALKLKEAGCSAVVVGPVGSARAQVSSVSLALLVQQRVPGLEAILTATTWEKSLMVLQADLLGAHAFGVRAIVCRTGTPPLHGDYPNAAGIWDVDSLGLIQVLHGLNEGRDYNGIPLGRPTAFLIGARINPAAADFAREALTARRKIAAGADYLITPPVYDLDALDRLLDAIGSPETPVLLGLMPLQDLRHAEYLQHEVPEMSVPEPLLERMWQAGERAPLVGLEIAHELAHAARARGRLQGLVLASATGSAQEMVRLLEAVGA
ncbi:MAG TPA: bifunctional homocysteine S-methyltransferase/methylenetetrahydrofolate reductase [Chloroflexota bacterium]